MKQKGELNILDDINGPSKFASDHPGWQIGHRRSQSFTRAQIYRAPHRYGDENMNTGATLDYDKIMEVAQNMGYDPTKPTELNEYISAISKMDLWDISKILFFGK